MNVLSLFSGIGGLDLGIKIACPEARVVAYVERDSYCRRVLLARMSDGSLDPAPIWDDVTTFDGVPWQGLVDCVIGGFPCQPVSLAGKRKAQADDRWLWPEFARVVRQVRPRLVFAENVPGLLVRGMDDVLRDLAGMGFDVWWGVVSAADVGAPQLRKRVFILAHAEGVHGEGSDSERDSAWKPQVPFGDRGSPVGNPAVSRLERSARQRIQFGVTGCRSCSLADPEGQCGELRSAEGERLGRPAGGGSVVGYACECGLHGDHGRRDDSFSSDGCVPVFPPGPADRAAWAAILAADPSLEPAVRRVADGSAQRVDRLRALGNAVCPLQAGAAFTELFRRMRSGK